MKKNNLISTVALVMMVILSACANSSSEPAQEGGVRQMDQSEFAKILKQEQAVVLDVRTPEEISAGYIKDATVFADINGPDFEARIDQLDKSKAYIVYCRSGARSDKAGSYMINKGFKKVYNLSGGIINWKGETVVPE